MSVIIDIIGSFTGKKAFKEADSAVASLTKSATKLAASLGVARLAQKSMLDAMADEKATKVLAQNLKNLGMAFAQTGAEQFIQTMQDQTGVLDDQLRPAYAQLARVTGSMLKTQELMKLAFDVSAGTGADYASVVDALSQAYVGNTKGLKSLNIGLTQSELKSKSFAEIQQILSDEFSGAGAASLDTYAGKMAILQAHASTASETIGKSLLDALTNVSGSNGFDEFISKVDTAAMKLADFITFTSRGVYAIENFFNPKKMAAAMKQWRMEDSIKSQQRSGMHVWQPEGYQTAEQKKAEADAKKRAAEILAAQKAQNKLATNNLKLQKAAAVFDMKKIQITAALKAANDEETVTRLKLMLAIENEQGTEAEKLQKKLDEIIAKNKTLQADLDNYKKSLIDGWATTVDPFAESYATLQKINGLLPSVLDKTGQLTGRGLHNIPSLTDAGGSMANVPYSGTGGGTTVINKTDVTVNGALDPVAVAGQIDQIFANAAGSTGQYTGLGLSYLQQYGAKAAGIG